MTPSAQNNGQGSRGGKKGERSDCVWLHCHLEARIVMSTLTPVARRGAVLNESYGQDDGRLHDIARNRGTLL